MFPGRLPSRTVATLRSRVGLSTSAPLWNNLRAVRYHSIPSYQPIHDSADFRIVKLGDLNLLDEIDKHNVVERRPVYHRRTGAVVRHIKVLVGTRRVYRARIFGSQNPMTAVVYNDPQFEQVSHHLHSSPLIYIFLHHREWLK
jgi:hypothetical protein